MRKVKIALLTGSLMVAFGAAGFALGQGKPDSQGFVRVQPEEMKWFPYPGDPGGFGLTEQFIIGDPSKPGFYVMRLKFPPHVMSTPHTHGEDRTGIVIKGTWYTGTGPDWDPAKTVGIKQGGVMLHPHGTVHYDGARDEEVIVQLSGIGPTSKIQVRSTDPSFAKGKN